VAHPLDSIPSAFANTQAYGERADAPPPPPTSGHRYQRIATLGQGGVGRVEHARDGDLLREVAVKMLRPDVARSPMLQRQFLWEARVTAHLDHPNIIPVHDLGVDADGRPFYTMKLVRGKTLKDALIEIAALAPRERDATLQRRLRWFLTICQAVAFAHARGVLHRDLKPSNVMIGEFGELLITDWGLAIPLPGAESQPLQALLPEGLMTESAGTPSYMSPEQARREALDARSDLFSLGVILYEMLGLQPAFPGSSLEAILARVKSVEVKPLDAARSLVAVVQKAMALRCEDRYPDVSALAADVERVLDGRTPAAEPVWLLRRVFRISLQPDRYVARTRAIFIYVLMAYLGLASVAFGARLQLSERGIRIILLMGLSLLIPLVLESWRVYRLVRRERKR
jgi:serine/threonine-protein kinase